MYGATIVAHSDAYFVISGSFYIRYPTRAPWEYDELWTQIGRLDYDTLQWSVAGRLESTTRFRAGAIFDGTQYVIVGGSMANDALHLASEFTETCVVVDKRMICKKLNESTHDEITEYIWPLLFHFDSL